MELLVWLCPAAIVITGILTFLGARKAFSVWSIISIAEEEQYFDNLDVFEEYLDTLEIKDINDE